MRELFRKLFGTDPNPTLADEVAALSERASWEYATAASKAQQARIESERLWAEAEAHDQAATRLHNLADKLDALLDPADPV